MENLRNVSYFFIPLTFSGDFESLINSLHASKSWHQVHDEIMYMLKYVADKFDGHDRKNCRCFHYELNDNMRRSFDLPDADTWMETEVHSFKDSETSFRFKLLSAQLFCFGTNVCILVFKLQFAENDSMWISSAQYHMKKVSKEKLSVCNVDKPPVTLLDIAKRIMKPLKSICEFDFFFYANPSTERANVLTYLETELKDDYKRDLFYLRRCYSEGYLYCEDTQSDDKEIYIPSKDIIWGISPEAAVCLACPQCGRESFIRETFFSNFNAQYLFMYVLLLHQKYVLYMFLTKIGIGTYNDRATLEEYRNQLYEFETDFVFSCVTEVPQYRNLYDKMVQAFSLKQMFKDVREPLVSLGEVRRAAAEEKERRRESSMNRVLFLISVLSFFPIFKELYGIIEAVSGWFLDASHIKVLYILCIVGIVLAGVLIFKNLFKSNKD